MSDVIKAASIAAIAHDGQTDMANKPYFDHCQRVADNVERWYSQSGKFGKGELSNLLCVAYLHDVVEDTDWTLTTLEELGKFNAEVIYGVDAMSQRWFAQDGGRIPYGKNVFGTLVREPLEDYWTRVKNNPLALIVKVHGDIPDNNDPARQVYLEPKLAEKMHNKYTRALAFLGETP